MHTCIILNFNFFFFFVILVLCKQLQIVEVPCKRILIYLLPYEHGATAVVDQHH